MVFYLLVIFEKHFKNIIINVSVQLERNPMMEKKMMKKVKILNQMKTVKIIIRKISNVLRSKTERINLLYTQILDVRFNRDPTLTIQKDIYIYKSRHDEI
jgi:hypothetical protein